MASVSGQGRQQSSIRRRIVDKPEETLRRFLQSALPRGRRHRKAPWVLSGGFFFSSQHSIGCRDFAVNGQSGVGGYGLAEWRLCGQDAILTIAVFARRCYQPGKLIQKLQWREIKNSLPTSHWFR